LDVPADIVTLASETIKTFFWNWKRSKFRTDLLVREIKKGGIKYPCLECKIKSWKILWATRALRLEEKNPLWMRIANTLLPNGLTICYLLNSKPTYNYLEKHCPDLPKFYRDIIITWTKATEKVDYTTKDSIRNECIWLNSSITVNNAPLWSETCIQHNVKYIKDILDDNNDFLSHVDINRRYNTRCTFLDILRIRLTVSHEWKQILKGESPENFKDLLKYQKLRGYKTLKTKDMYWLILKDNHDCLTPSNPQIYWETKYKKDNEYMEKVFELPYLITRRTSLQALQYKITYKIINYNYWLEKIKITDSAKCRFCTEEETIEHFFFACKLTKAFWRIFQTWWNNLQITEVKIINEYDVMLGFFHEGVDNKILNCCTLLAKQMIYRRKNIDLQPDLYRYLCDLKEYLDIERHIAINNNYLDAYIDNWGPLLDT
jgi:hypothetical protein